MSDSTELDTLKYIYHRFVCSSWLAKNACKIVGSTLGIRRERVGVGISHLPNG